MQNPGEHLDWVSVVNAFYSSNTLANEALKVNVSILFVILIKGRVVLLRLMLLIVRFITGPLLSITCLQTRMDL